MDDDLLAELERLERQIRETAGLSAVLCGRYGTRLVRREDGTVYEEPDGIASGYAIANLLNAARVRADEGKSNDVSL